MPTLFGDQGYWFASSFTAQGNGVNAAADKCDGAHGKDHWNRKLSNHNLYMFTALCVYAHSINIKLHYNQNWIC